MAAMEEIDPTCNPMQTLLDERPKSHVDQSQNSEKVDVAIPQQPGPDDFRNYDIVRATQYGVIERVQELIEGGFDVNENDRENVSLLHWAAINNRTEIVKYFVRKGAVVDKFGGDLNSTPLHWATRQGHLKMVVQLMSLGADPTLRDGEGCSCIHLAAQFGHTAIVAYLIAKGNDVDMVDQHGMTALMYASYRIFAYDPVRMLLTFGASLDKTDKIQGNSPLHFACQSANTVVIKTLINAGANLDALNAKRQTPIDLAAMHKHTAVVKRLHEMRIELGYDTRHCLQKYTNDKNVRRKVMLVFPFIALWAIGAIPEMEADWYVKLALAAVGIVIWKVVAHFFFDDKMMVVMPISIYLATKLWMYYTWFAYLVPYIQSTEKNILFTLNTLLLTYNFWKAWRTDPGYIETDRTDKVKVILELAEDQTLSLNQFCSTCLIHRPIRSKHCNTCNKCVAKMDHHCPWIDNCVGVDNHKYFIGYLIFLFGMICWCFHGCQIYWNHVCPFDIYVDGITGIIYKIVKASPWVAWIAINSVGHMLWVGILLSCQMYQIVWLGMTTNERINFVKYEYLHDKEAKMQDHADMKGHGHSHAGHAHHSFHGGAKAKTKNPFHRGMFKNMVDLLGWRLCGLLRPNKLDYRHLFVLPGEQAAVSKRLKFNVNRENYQFV
ncbi:palmitoyltransferase ZDHHC17-like [Pecten maximus]|uniref:palmitoyltransferase ZDHHC17-like n=1 Tax=Pecten maximus TaxID=6579 RepID=UPI001458C78A|nr:palmitoyltransferase ZDHHC17-like [Pecten maximus]